MDNLTFTEQDKEMSAKFASFMAQMKMPELPMTRLSEFYSCMVWYNQLMKKIDANIFEVKQIVEQPKEEKSKKVAAPKEVK